MAEAAGLVVTFRGDAGPMTKSLADLQSQIKRFKGALDTATDPSSIARLNKAIDATGSRIKALQSFTGKPLDNLTKSGNQASQSILNTGRVIQDLPYAFNNFGSIANNLDPLFESFTRLRENAKLTGKSVGASLLESVKGAAGIGLALSAVTTGIVIWQMYGDKIKYALGLTKELGSETDKAKNKIKTFFDLQREVNSGIAQELSQVQQLKIVLESEVTTRKDKEAALKRLKDINPDYFKDLKLEDGLIQKLNSSYGEYVKSILKRSEVKVLEKQLDQLNETIINLQTSTANDSIGDKLVKGLSLKMGHYAALQKTNIANAKKDAVEGVKMNSLLNDREVILQRLAALAEHIDVPNIDLKEPKVKTPKESFEFFNKFFGFNPNGTLSAKQEAGLMDAANDFAKKFGDIFEGLNFYPPGAKKKPLELAKSFWEDLKKGIVTFKPTAFLNIDFTKDIPTVIKGGRGLGEAFTEGLKQGLGKQENLGGSFKLDKAELFGNYEAAFRDFGQKLPKTITLPDGLGKMDVPIDIAFLIDPKGTAEALKKEFLRMQGLVQGLNEKFAATLRDMQMQAVSSIGEALAAGLTGGNIQGVFSGLFAALGTAMQDLGKALIATAIGLKAIKDAFKTLNPVVAAAAGVGLIALGAVIKGKVSKAAPFAHGGMVYGPVNALVGEGPGTSRNNPEIIAPLNELKKYIGGGGQTVVVTGRIKGNDILLSNSRQNKRNRRGG